MAEQAELNVEPENKAPLEDIMVAMDVVDTLRHDQRLAERELDQEGRRARLLLRLKDLYASQGIEVPDQVLQEGIEALEQERFKYTPTTESWQTKLARVWVGRGRWGKPIGFLAVIASIFYGIYFTTDVLPIMSLRSELPEQLDSSMASIINEAKNSEVIEGAQQLAASARLALQQDKLDEAQSLIHDLHSIENRLKQEYTIQVVSRPNENSGVWRVPPNNSEAKNYYLIVEAVNKNKQSIKVDVVNEEDNSVSLMSSWGLRVNADTFFRVAADKKDDGIIQANKVGAKQRGYLEPEFSIPTTGATITSW